MRLIFGVSKKLLLMLLIAVFVGAGGYLLLDYFESERDQSDLDRLINSVSRPSVESGTSQDGEPRVLLANIEIITPLNTEVTEGNGEASGTEISADEPTSPVESAAPGATAQASPTSQPASTSIGQVEATAQPTPATEDTAAPVTSATPDTQTDPSSEPSPTAQIVSATPTAEVIQVASTEDPEPTQTPETTDSQPEQSAEPTQTPEPTPIPTPTPPRQAVLDTAKLIEIIQMGLARDWTFANPAIETLRLQIPSTILGDRPSVSIRAIGDSLRTPPNTADMEGEVSDWLQEAGWFSDRLQVIDMRIDLELPILPQYSELYEQNPDMIGWFQIEGTKMNAPVMQTVEDPEYYLKHNFEHQYSNSGMPFLDARNDLYDPWQNLILYGHNMYNSGRMFGALSQYEGKTFLGKHPIIKFDLLTEQREYEVFAMFRSRFYKAHEKGGFRYYDYLDLSRKADFNDYVQQVKNASIIDTGITPQWGDELITLSTCSYHVNKGTFVVVARRIK